MIGDGITWRPGAPPSPAEEDLRARCLLVEFDGSKAAWAALRYAERIARRNHGRLVVAFVVNGGWCACGWPGLSIAVPAAEVERLAMHELRSAIATLADDVSVISAVVRGPVGATLVRTAAQYRCDAIVVGRRPPSARIWMAGRH